MLCLSIPTPGLSVVIFARRCFRDAMRSSINVEVTGAYLLRFICSFRRVL